MTFWLHIFTKTAWFNTNMCSIGVVAFCVMFCVYVSAEKSTTRSTSPVSSRSSGCAKCGTTKAGKGSCCARGGAWFKNCGDVSDRKFDHTWAEGIQACKGLVNLVSVAPMMQVKIRKEGFIVSSVNSVHRQRSTHQRTTLVPCLISDLQT